MSCEAQRSAAASSDFDYRTCVTLPVGLEAIRHALLARAPHFWDSVTLGSLRLTAAMSSHSRETARFGGNSCYGAKRPKCGWNVRDPELAKRIGLLTW